MTRPSERLPRLGPEHEAVRLLGQGGMGSVFEVVATRTGVRYAAKTVLPQASERARARFLREAELLARCDRHPGVVKVHALGRTEAGQAYLLLDLVRGEGLDALLEREGRLEPRRAATLARDIAAALAFVHAQGVVHRDVKPSNVLLDADAGGAPRLTDFGLATADDVERLTRTGEFLGTIAYVAPEQLATREAGPAADVFSLGALLFRALAGTTPFAGADAISIIAHLTSAEPAPPVRTLAPEVPVPLARVVARALEKRVRDRYPDAAALGADLERFLRGEPVLADERRVRARRRVAAGAVLGLLVCGAVALQVLGERQAAARARAAAEEALATARRALHDAQDAVAAGQPGRALDLLAGAFDRDARLTRARALLALGRLEDARGEAAAALDGSPPATTAQVETAADVLAASGDPARAVKLYTGLLKQGGRRTAELAARRGGAAFAAGDRAQALADLALAIPEPGALSDSRDQNARLAPLAPVLYARALDRDPVAGERDLDAAWRLADPPAALAPEVARRWTGRSTRSVETSVLANAGLSGTDVAALRRAVELEERALAIAPDVAFPKEMDRVSTLLFWTTGTDGADSLRAVVGALRPVAPREAVLDYVAAKAAFLDRNGDPEVARLLLVALDRAPARRHPVRDQLVQSIVSLGALAITKGADTGAFFDRMACAARETPEANLLADVARLACEKGRLDLAESCIADAVRAPGIDDARVLDWVACQSISVLAARGKLEEALAAARRRDAANPTEASCVDLAKVLRDLGRADDLAALLRSRSDVTRGTLLDVAGWLRAHGHPAEADELDRRAEKLQH